MGGDHPVAWSKRVGLGRVWYTALGHTEASFTEALFLQHLLGGIQVAAGTKPADFKP
jgi:type 1 glutamine amidotransferase